jgi:hypothetical protein
MPLLVRTPRVKLPDGRVVQIEPDWFGKLSGFTLLFEALVLAMAQQMTFAAVARLVYESWHRVHAICLRYVDLAVAAADLSAVTAVAIDETSYRRGHNYLTVAADAGERKVDEEAFVLEEIEVPQPLGLRVMDRVHTLDTRRPKPATGDEVDADRQHLSRRIKSTTRTYHGLLMPSAASNSWFCIAGAVCCQG